MSSVSDYSLANQGFSAFRTELNNILGAINTTNLATSAPSSLAAGSMWVDSSSAGTHTVKYYDGSDSITLFNINTSANTVDFIDSSVTTELVNDTSPQLGGNLDTNSHNILIDDAHFIGDENGLEQIIFQTTASAVNELEVTNAATGNPPILGASGETNVDLHIKPKGSGETIIGSGGASATLTTSGTYDLVLDTNKGTNSGNITITDGANGAIDLTTNGTGAIKFNDMAYVPQQAITSSSNAVAWDAQAKSNAYHVTTENTTFAAPSNAVEGAFICVEINYNGSHTISWNTVYEWSSSTEPTTTDTDAKTDIFVFRYNGAVWQEVGRTLNLSES
tara:strand:- start:3185 stop:4189 length:1005 start_codon:yes stop_codon:yes gene_type:complete